MTNSQLELLLFDLALILLVTPLSARIARRLGQPAVIGEIIFGILAGPTLVHGALSHLLFPAGVRPFLNAVANIGLVTFMFMVGMEIDRRSLRGMGRVTLGTALGATAAPLGAGVLLACYLSGEDGSRHRLGFVLFTGVALSVTAFPVLARIVADRRMTKTPLGATALAAAALCDVTAWTMLAIVTAIVDGRSDWQVALIIPYAALVLLGARPLLRKLLARGDPAHLPTVPLALVLTGLLASAAITQLLGLHVVFGAFLFGMAMPGADTSAPRGEILKQLRFATLALMPVYFVIAGLGVNLSDLGTAGLAQLGLITVTAVTAKLGGAFAGARTQGLATRQSALLAVLMNTRGLTELIALSVGLQIGVIDTRLYSLLVVMAVVTTAMTGPLTRVLGWREQGSEVPAPAPRELAAVSAEPH